MKISSCEKNSMVAAGTGHGPDLSGGDKMRIIQLIETLVSGDGMGNHAILTHNLLKRAGFQVETYAVVIGANVPKGIAKVFSPDFEIKTDDIILLQFGTGGIIGDNIKKYACRKIMMYQNITPPCFFEGYDAPAYNATTWGYRLIHDWAENDVFDAVIAPSQYSLDELHKMGIPPEKTYLLPGCLMPIQSYSQDADEEALEDYQDGHTNILFVGRVTPNKKQQDIIRIFAYYQKNMDPTAKLILVGSGLNSTYGEAIRDYIEELGVENVIFPGFISSEVLVAIYKSADVFLCMSEHEGFCIPLVEAMLYGVPIIAYDAAAVSGTLGGAGILVQDKNPVLISKWIQRIVSDRELREAVIESENERLKNFEQSHIEKAMLEILGDFINKNIGRYEYSDDTGLHEKEAGLRMSGMMYDVLKENFLEIGEILPCTKETYLREVMAEEVHLY